VRWDPAKVGATAGQIHAALLNGDPSILINGMPDGLRVNPYMLEDGEAAIVARRLRELLTHPPAAAPKPAPAAPTVDVSGEWTLDVQFLASSATHVMRVQQQDAGFCGSYRSEYLRSEVKGSVAGDVATFRVTLPVGMFRPTYEFTGTVTGNTMTGKGHVGQEWPVSFAATRNA